MEMQFMQSSVISARPRDKSSPAAGGKAEQSVYFFRLESSSANPARKAASPEKAERAEIA